MIGKIIDAWADDYISCLDQDAWTFRETYLYFMYSQDLELKNKWREFINQEKIAKRKEKWLYTKYENMVITGKNEKMPVTIFRDNKIVHEWKQYWYLCVGLETYDKDKEKYKYSIYVDEMTNPYLYSYIKKKWHTLNLKPL